MAPKVTGINVLYDLQRSIFVSFNVALGMVYFLRQWTKPIKPRVSVSVWQFNCYIQLQLVIQTLRRSMIYPLLCHPFLLYVFAFYFEKINCLPEDCRWYLTSNINSNSRKRIHTYSDVMPPKESWGLNSFTERKCLQLWDELHSPS